MRKIKLTGYIAFSIVVLTILVACNEKFEKNEGQSEIIEDKEVNEANTPNIGEVNHTGTMDDGQYNEGTLEDYFNNPLNAYIIEDFKNSLGNGYDNIYKDVKISFKKNRMTYEFYFTEDHGYSQESIEPILKNSIPKLFDELRTHFNPKDKLEIEMIYYNPNGSTSADVICKEDEDNDKGMFDSEAEPGTVQYYYETRFGTVYWENSAETAKEMSNGIYSDIEIEIIGNSLKYKYYLITNVGDIQDFMGEDFTDEYMNSCIEQLKAPSEIEGMVFLEYIFYNPDGTIAAQFSAQG